MQLAEEHNANTKRLKAAKEAAEAAQAQMQKDTREEIERMKTQYTFRVCQTLADDLYLRVVDVPISPATRDRSIDAEANLLGEEPEQTRPFSYRERPIFRERSYEFRVSIHSLG